MVDATQLNGDFSQWGKYILLELQRLDKNSQEISSFVTENQLQITKLTGIVERFVTEEEDLKKTVIAIKENCPKSMAELDKQRTILLDEKEKGLLDKYEKLKDSLESYKLSMATKLSFGAIGGGMGAIIIKLVDYILKTQGAN
jgi:hypothetical protein